MIRTLRTFGFPILTGLLLSFASLSCAGETPTTLAEAPLPDAPPASLQQDGPISGTALIAAAMVEVDLETLTTTMDPIREGQLTFGLEFPGVYLGGYLGSDPCSTCLRLETIDLDPIRDELTISFAIKHPFRAYPDFPRADLDAFDVKGVILLPEPVAGATAFNTEVADGVKVKADVFSMRNADGYTSTARGLWTDNTFIDPAFGSELSTLNPFKYFQSDGEARRFRQGQGFEARPFTFDVSRTFGTLRFLLAIVGNYGTPIRAIADRPTPQYFIPGFNQKEAYRVEVYHKAGATPLEWKNPGSQTVLEVLVSDHQRGLAAKGAAIEWDDPASTIPFPSDVNSVEVEVPAIANAIFSTGAASSGTGTFGDPYVYSVLVDNDKGASFGTYPMLVKVNDEMEGFAAYAVGDFRVPYDDDFERENPFTATGWIAAKPLPGSGPGWGAYNSGGGLGTYFDDNNNEPYENNVGLTLNTPVFDLTYSSDLPVLEILHSYDLEPMLDGAALFLSVDGGLNFDYRKPITVLTGRGYDGEILPKTAPFDMLAYKQAFTGDSEGNAVTQFDLSAAAGKKQVVVQFLFSSNASGGGSTPPFYKGWSIYNVKLIP